MKPSAHKAIMEAERPEPNHLVDYWETDQGTRQYQQCFVDKLEAYADRMAAERDYNGAEWAKSAEALVIQVNRAETAERERDRHMGAVQAYIEDAEHLTRQLAAAEKLADDADTDKLRAIGLYESCAADRKALQDALAELQAKHDALVKDAERYRWLAGDVPQHSTRWQRWKLEYWSGFHGGWQPLTSTELDEAIDAAIQESKK